MRLRSLSSLLILAGALTGTASQRATAQSSEPLTDVPPFGTFYLTFQNTPPLPFDPYGGLYPVYEVADGVYLVDDTQAQFTPFHLFNPMSLTNAWRVRFNGQTYYSASDVPGFVVPYTPTLGRSGTPQNWDGEFAEIIFFNRGLTDAERTAVEHYLNRKYLLWQGTP